MTTYKKWSLVSFFSLMLAACGGDSTQDGATAPATGMEGRVTIAGGLAGATIFVDLNGSSGHDPDEPLGYTDAQGFFGYNPVSRTNYCRSQDADLRRHCLRLPSLSSLPDEVTIFYLGGVNLVTGEQNDKVYRYHVRVDELRGQDLDLDAARAAISAAADSEEGVDILYGIIDAFYRRHLETPAPLGRMSLFAADELSAQEKFDALVEAGIFEGMDAPGSGLDGELTRAQVASIMAKLLQRDQDAPPSTSVMDLDGSEWAWSYIAAVTASSHLDETDGVFAPGADVTLEQLAIVLVRALDLPVDDATTGSSVSDWARAYVEAAVEAGLLGNVGDYTSPSVRSLLVGALYEGRDQLAPEATPEVASQVSSAAGELIENLFEDEALNDSFTEAEFDSLLAGLVDLIRKASDDGQRINMDALRGFLADVTRDWTEWEEGNFDDLLLDPAFFDDTIELLKGRVLDIDYDNPAKGGGRLQLLLSPGAGEAGIDGGRLQACVRYEEVGVPEYEQRFGTPMYVSGTWSRINDNSILLNMNLLPGYTYARVLQLDWAEVAENPEISTVRFDMTDELEDWSVALVHPVPYEWEGMDANREAANATCALLLAD